MMKNLLLYIAWNPSSEAFHLGPLTFRWYSLCWLIGLVIAYLVVRRLYKSQQIPQEKFDPLFIYCFVGILVGARLGHCIFYQPQVYLTSLDGIIEMLLPIKKTVEGWQWSGYEGLASHGGTAGLILALWLYVRRTKLPVWQVLDNIAIATGITACFIRLGNLMNSEIVGSVTSVPWAFVFESRIKELGPEPRHPSQLYEAFAYLLLFLVMIYLYRRETTAAGAPKRVGTGFYCGLCLTWIFTFRFFIEFLKKNQVGFEENMFINVGQLLSLPFVVFGIWCMIRARKKLHHTST